MINKILIVDNNKNERKMMHHTLSVSGYNIVEAESSSSALIAISNHPDVDLIIVSWSINEIRENSTFSILHENFSYIPIIIIGMSDGNESIITALKMGAVDYITKPVNKELLLFKIDNVLSRDHKSLTNKAATRKQVLFEATCDITLTSITKQSIIFETNFNIPKDTITTFTCHDLAEKLDIPFKTKFSCKIISSEQSTDETTNSVSFYRISAVFLNLSPILASKIQDAINKNRFNTTENNKGFI